jgi:hypothetical protein
MESYRVGAIGRPRREHPRQRDLESSTRMHLKHVASRVVQPRQNDKLVASRDA